MAEDLFQQGRAFLEKGNYEEACPKFAESYRLDGGLGALLNLAVCHERAGKVASARAEFLEAAASARRRGDAEREDMAQRHAADLAPRVPHVVFRFVPSLPPAARLELDGVSLLPSAWDPALAVDPGAHVVRMTAEGKKELTARFVTSADGRTETVPLGPFEDVTSAAGRSVHTTAVQESASHGVPPRTILAIASGAAGVVGLGVGTFFGIRTFALKDERGSHCDASNGCDPRGLALDSHARDTALVSTVSIAAGAALVAVATFLWLSAPPRTN